MPNEVIDQKAFKLLNKLLQAAQKAEREGKYLALSKIITEANKLGSKLNAAQERFHYTPVTGEIIS
jgi:hypothetical protein